MECLVIRNVVLVLLFCCLCYTFADTSQLTADHRLNQTLSIDTVEDDDDDDDSVPLYESTSQSDEVTDGHCKVVTLHDVFTSGLRLSQLYLAASSSNAAIHLLLQGMSPVNTTAHVRCIAQPMPAGIPRVQIVNGSQLLELLAPRNQSTRGRCAVVLFYAPWCVFCARVAAHFNALARAFPLLPVFAIDAMHFSNSNYRFGTVAVPNMLVFHNSKAIARFNHSVKILENMVEFLSNVTGLQANLSVGLLPSDYIGPLPSKPTDEHDLLLWAAWMFVLFSSVTMFLHSTAGRHLCHSLFLFGQEHQHLHVE